MDRRALHGKQLLAAVVFVGAILVLAVQLINPSPVMVSIGENGAEANQVGEYFTYGDVAMIVVSSALGSASGTYLILGNAASAARPSTTATTPAPTNEPNGSTRTSTEGVEKERDRQDGPNVPLKDNEETIYSLLTDADGELPQREIVEETALSKATVSRTLDALEHKDLVERKRRGMGNVVRLQ